MRHIRSAAVNPLMASAAVPGGPIVDGLLLLSSRCLWGHCVLSLFCNTVLTALCSFAIVSLVKRELVAILYSKTCLKRPLK